MSEPNSPTTGLTLEALQHVRETMHAGVGPLPYEHVWIRASWHADPLVFHDTRPGEIITVSASTGERDLARGGRHEGESALRGIVYPSYFKRRGTPHYSGLNRKQRRAQRFGPPHVSLQNGAPLVPGRPGELGTERPVVPAPPEASSFRAGMSLPGVHGNYAVIDSTLLNWR